MYLYFQWLLLVHLESSFTGLWINIYKCFMWKKKSRTITIQSKARKWRNKHFFFSVASFILVTFALCIICRKKQRNVQQNIPEEISLSENSDIVFSRWKKKCVIRVFQPVFFFFVEIYVTAVALILFILETYRRTRHRIWNLINFNEEIQQQQPQQQQPNDNVQIQQPLRRSNRIKNQSID